MKTSKLLSAAISIFLLCFATSPGFALADIDGEAVGSVSSSGLSLSESSNDDEFLPVEVAYQLSVDRTDAGVNLSWAVADHYFLYGEKFEFFVNGNPVDAVISEGVVKYDPIFEKDVIKHYGQASASIASGALPQNGGFELKVLSQGCADAGLCYPPQTQYFTVSGTTITAISESDMSAPVTMETASSSQSSSTPSPIKAASFAKIISMIGFAFLGGMVLNLMPCVLPVLSLKALSLANNDNDHKKQGWSYTLGAISTFVFIAALLLIVRAAGQAVGWGFQLQSPGFVTVLVFLFFIMGLSLSGTINIGTSFMSVGQNLTQGDGLKQSYFTGVLAAVVASPCTAPFMAPALGFAITQPWWSALSIFAGLGFGMAFPLLLLSYMPHLGRWLPAPGAWMDTFKQALAFPLYLTALWLLWVLGRQLGMEAAMLALLVALVVVFIFWLGQRVTLVSKATGMITLALVAGVTWHISKQTPAEKGIVASSSVWQPYTEQGLEDMRKQGKSVFVNMTADWCITCKVNEKVVFTDDALEFMQAQDIQLVKGDWTNYDPKITKLLEKYKRGGVPLYLLFPSDGVGEPQVLPQILTPAVLKDAITNNS